MVWKQPWPETLETARSESSRDPETQKLHGLKAAETQKIYHPSQLGSEIKLKLKRRVKIEFEGEEIWWRNLKSSLSRKIGIEAKSRKQKIFELEFGHFWPQKLHGLKAVETQNSTTLRNLKVKLN